VKLFSVFRFPFSVFRFPFSVFGLWILFFTAYRFTNQTKTA